MLVGLHVRDVALIDKLDLEFDRGLTVLTGETGAGKSILLDALGLALGARSDTALIRVGAEKAVVSASFAVASDHPARRVTAERDIAVAQDDAIVLRRVVLRDGPSRAFVNDAPVSAGFLKELGATLVEVQGQHDQQMLLSGAGHRRLLDEFGGLEPAVDAVAATFATFDAARTARTALKDEIARVTAEEDLLRHQATELDALDPKRGEEVELAGTRALLMAAEKSGAALRGASEKLETLPPALSDVGRSLAQLPEAARPRFAAALAAVERAAIEIGDAQREIDQGIGAVDADPKRLEAIDDRLHALRDAARKHRTTPDLLADLRARIGERLAAIDRGAEVAAAAETAVTEARAAFCIAAASLSAHRRKTAKKLDTDVSRELAALMLAKAVFRTRIEPRTETEWSGIGADSITFEIATLPGVEPGPLAKIASGGELSRILLALKVALAGVGDAATLIFDEIDRGVGGATADAVGVRLQRVANGHQVLVVTHSPQVTARGAHHFRVVKDERRKGAKAMVERLARPERLEEVARMLAGATVTDEARAAAERLLAGVDAPAQKAVRSQR
ncbi:MAG: DNA repair protein RecN [Alphaproteobacteria bacterium]|nr:DNA repair protein RecN [Alphaproteobacteria bacterium]